MFITKKHISRRTLLRGAGVALGLPSARRDVSRRDGAGAGGRGSAASILRGLRPARRGAGLLGSREGRRVARGAAVHLDSRSSRTANSLTILTRPACHFVRAAARRNRRRPLGRRGVPVRRQAEENRRRRRVAPARRSTRSSREKIGARNAAAFGGDVRRRSRLGLEQLRRRLQLRVHEHDRVGVADDAVADGVEPAGRVRAHVRQRQHARAARRAPRAQPEHPRLDQRQDRRACAREISVPDRSRLDSFTENVREIERRLADRRQAPRPRRPRISPCRPGIPQSFDEHIKLMFDLLALAFQADITRVGTLLFARDLTGRRLPAKAKRRHSGFHGVSHHGEDPQLINDALEDQPIPRQDAGVLRRQARQDRRWRRHAARPFAAPVRQQHGQSEPAPALRRAARADRRQPRQR